MTLRCWFGWHATKLVTDGDRGAIVCQHCPKVFDEWPLLRPEEAVRQQRAHERAMKDRERRVQEMAGRQRVVRFR
jgi:hypothetical protein